MLSREESESHVTDCRDDVRVSPLSALDLATRSDFSRSTRRTGVSTDAGAGRLRERVF